MEGLKHEKLFLNGYIYTHAFVYKNSRTNIRPYICIQVIPSMRFADVEEGGKLCTISEGFRARQSPGSSGGRVVCLSAYSGESPFRSFLYQGGSQYPVLRNGETRRKSRVCGSARIAYLVIDIVKAVTRWGRVDMELESPQIQRKQRNLRGCAACNVGICIQSSWPSAFQGMSVHKLLSFRGALVSRCPKCTTCVYCTILCILPRGDSANAGILENEGIKAMGIIPKRCFPTSEEPLSINGIRLRTFDHYPKSIR